MSDKIAEIRREVEERRKAFRLRTLTDVAVVTASTEGVVIYGVPLNEGEIESLRDHLGRAAWKGPSISAIWEMLERGKK